MSIYDSMEKIRSLLPPEVQKQWKEQEAREAMLKEDMRQEIAQALSRLADALAYPRVARSDLEQAEKHIAKALSIAAVIDPE